MTQAETLTRRKFTALVKALADEQVLSVYLARESSDPGGGEIWRRRLDAETKKIRATIESDTPSQLPDFDEALRRITKATSEFGRVLPMPGWVVFATKDQLWLSERLPYTPDALVRWQQGVFAAPYVRSFKGDRPLVVAIVDEWNARIHDVHDGALTDAVELAAERSLGDMSDAGVSKRGAAVTGATGVRGATRADAARRILDEEAKRLRARIGAELLSRVGDDGGVVLGGIPKAVRAVLDEIGERLEDRITDVTELSFDTDPKELTTKVQAAASTLTVTRQAKMLESCAESTDRGSMGWNDTHRALDAGAVDTLLLSRVLIESAPDDAERLLTSALAQGADVEEVGGELGTRLMEESDGVAARLRFRPGVPASQGG